jgi:hypothetical protein
MLRDEQDFLDSCNKGLSFLKTPFSDSYELCKGVRFLGAVALPSRKVSKKNPLFLKT